MQLNEKEIHEKRVRPGAGRRGRMFRKTQTKINEQQTRKVWTAKRDTHAQCTLHTSQTQEKECFIHISDGTNCKINYIFCCSSSSFPVHHTTHTPFLFEAFKAYFVRACIGHASDFISIIPTRIAGRLHEENQKRILTLRLKKSASRHRRRPIGMRWAGLEIFHYSAKKLCIDLTEFSFSSSKPIFCVLFVCLQHLLNRLRLRVLKEKKLKY